ncbi:MAG: methyltransferase [Alphaproteobacteria bacterium]|nr:methyltransferase [Alphaproteobacteria bacterium]
MTPTTKLTPDLDYVEAELDYIVDDGIPAIRYLDWPEMEHLAHMPTYEKRRVRIHNGRMKPTQFTLPSHGFAFIDHRTKVRDFFDEEEVRSIYYPETEELIQAHSGGANRVLVFDHTLRTAKQARQQADRVRKAVHSVHNDYTESSAPQRVRDFLPEDEAAAALEKRFAIIQTWRSIAPRVERDPLALCDGKTIPNEGFVPYQRRYRYRTGETYHISYNPSHQWFWFPQMTREEALVFKVYDTDASAGVRFTAHTAFDDPNAPLDSAIRESIEMRALVFYN